MEFLLNETQRRLRDSIRALAGQDIIPHQGRVEEPAITPESLRVKLTEAGLWGVLRPAACADRECSTMDAVIIYEELSRRVPLAALSLAEHNLLFVRHLERFGDARQREKYLTAPTPTPTLGSWCPADAAAASRPGVLRTRAEKDGDVWILNGAKMVLANRGRADWTIVTAITDVSQAKEGLSSFVVASDAEGLCREEDKGLQAPDGPKTGNLILENVKVPSGDLIGREGAGVRDLMSLLDESQVCLAALCLGLAAAALETCVVRGRGKSPSRRARRRGWNVTAELADRLTNLETARLMTYRAALVQERALDAAGESTAACVYAADVALKSTALATQAARAGRNGRNDPRLFERAAAIIKRWIQTKAILDNRSLGGS